ERFEHRDEPAVTGRRGQRLPPPRGGGAAAAQSGERGADGAALLPPRGAPPPGTGGERGMPLLSAQWMVAPATPRAARSSASCCAACADSGVDEVMAHVVAAQLRRRTRNRCNTTNTSRSAPITIRVHHELSVPSNEMNVWIRPRTSTPSTEPTTSPAPPESSVPPMTVAAM